ncbi:MAG TPA: WG repeat-containing protein, partial [Flavisolibacter sp.]|nr:WG repeat-containing protein [Flavisolibacter sp.]
MKCYILFLSAFISMGAYTQQWTKQYDFVDDAICGLSKVGKGEKRGYVDKDGNLVVPLIYDDAMQFNEGMAAVKKGSKWGYVDSTGKEIVPFIYEEAYTFSEHMGLVMKNNMFGFINKSGEVIIPIQYENAS